MKDSLPPLHINGKWLAHETSGTERYAGEIVRRLISDRSRRFVLHLPSNAQPPTWAEQCTIRRSRSRGQLFEQVVLPLKTIGAPLINLAGPAPVIKRRQLVAMHDASVFALGSTYHWTFRLWYRAMYTLLSRGAKTVVTVSHFSARELAKATNVPLSRFEVVSNGAEHLATRDKRRADTLARPYVLLVGGNIPHKHTHWAVAALSALDVEIIVVGKIRASRQFSDEGEPNDHACWVGRVSDEQLRQYYANALCLVFPSLYEGFGIPILEAQAAECAVLTSRNAALPEVAGDGALYFDTSSPEQLRNAVDRLCRDPAFRADLVRRGTSNLSRYSWDRSAAQVHALTVHL